MSDAAGAGGMVASADIGCTRPGLTALITRYLAAMAAHNPALLPVAPNLKSTEDTKPMKLGDGLWKSAGQVSYRRDALDTETCSAVTTTVMDMQGTATIYGVRLKLGNQLLTEVEAFTAATQGIILAPNPDGLVSSMSDVSEWQATLPANQRSTRDQLTAIADNYFTSLGGAADLKFGNPCAQASNGTTLTTCFVAPAPPIPGFTGPPTHRRFPVVDVEAGIVVGLSVAVADILTVATIKVKAGEIRFIDTLYGLNTTTLGWE